jgi:hypothetical protein
MIANSEVAIWLLPISRQSAWNVCAQANAVTRRRESLQQMEHREETRKSDESQKVERQSSE